MFREKIKMVHMKDGTEMQYTDIKSEYIKDKLKKTRWKDSDYINKLMFIEDCILHGPGGMGSSICFHNYKSKYSKEYWTILKELKPAEYKKEKPKEERKRKKDMEEMKRFHLEEKEQHRKAREAWKKAGGLD